MDVVHPPYNKSQSPPQTLRASSPRRGASKVKPRHFADVPAWSKGAVTDVVNDFGEGPRTPRGPSPTTRWAIVLSLAAHLLIPLAMLSARPSLDAPPAEPEPMVVTLFDQPPPPPPEPAPVVAEIPAPPAPAKPLPPAKPAPKLKTHLSPRPAPVAPVYVSAALVTEPFPNLSDGQLAGAMTAGGGGGSGSGGGGGAPCDMVERLQAALRRDPDIQSAVAGARRGTAGRALHVWNGDWVQNPGQAGKGLAGLRQAIAMEIAFAPAACRTQSMRGLVLITLGDGAGAGRLALGTGAWRWSDLLAAHR